MPTRIAVQRGLLARVPGLAGVWVEDGPVPVIHLIPQQNADSAQLRADIEAALPELVVDGIAPTVQISKDASQAEGTGLVGAHRLAALSSSPTADGLRQGLMKLVPSIRRLVLETALGRVRFLISGENNTCSKELLDEASRAVHTLGSIGIEYEVAALEPTDPRDDLRDPGFLIPARDRKLEAIREEDEARFEGRLRSLVESDECESLPLIDNLDGEKIFSTIGLAEAPLGAFLPIYDHVYLTMAPGEHGSDSDYYVKNYGLSEDNLLAYVRAGKVVPVFKFELGVYPERVWRRFSEDLTLRYISARELDYACARYAWSSAEWIRMLRRDRSASQELFKRLRRLEETTPESRFAASFIRSLLTGAETFEGDFWRHGHLATTLYSPALPLVLLMEQSVPSKSMAPLEVDGAAMHLSMGLSLGAATYEGMVQSEPLLRAVAQQFHQTPSSVLAVSDGAQVRQILDALELTYSDDISPDEYIEIVNEANVRRIRELVAALAQGKDLDGADIDVRERIQAYNASIRRLTKKELSSTEVTALTALGASAFGLGWLKALGVGLTSTVAQKLVEPIDSTQVGDALDWLRGKLHRVPKETIRLYKIRSRLAQARRKS